MKKLLLLICIWTSSWGYFSIFASVGDTLKIQTFDKTEIITDPSKGWNEYQIKVAFPSQKRRSFQKAWIRFTFACHPKRRCGEWDTVNKLFIEHKKDSLSQRIELMRFITPYGSYWHSKDDWSFAWNYEITDFIPLLKDSVSLVYRHGGYEDNKTKGWAISADFFFVEGPPFRRLLSWELLPWTGKAYGLPEDPIQNRLPDVSFHASDEVHSIRCQLIQTGHGMDKPDNCAEFCAKRRYLWLDGELINQRYLWKKCGNNPLFPQAGTWTIDRANWCPGQVVYPDNYDIILGSKVNSSQDTRPIDKYSKNNPDPNTHLLRMEMESYTASAKREANYPLSAYLFKYGKPRFQREASLEEVIAPNPDPLYGRYNPICADPVVVIQNKGAEVLYAVRLRFGLLGSKLQAHTWEGKLSFMQKDTVILKGLLDWTQETDIFRVFIEIVNGYEDEYESNNAMQTQYIPPPIQSPGSLRLALLTNKSSQEENFLYLQDLSQDRTVFSNHEFLPEAYYDDEIPTLPGRCYSLVFSDEGSPQAQQEYALKNAPDLYTDGLSYWYTAKKEGKGSIAFVYVDPISGIKKYHPYNPDFGTRVVHRFITSGEVLGYLPTPWQRTKSVSLYKLSEFYKCLSSRWKKQK
ncbi:MAG: peptide-N-glycosidase F-related protein [Cytophagales bacterium]|nr:peptide-N-glycosidase F-related protein [Cytophagales bacterium]